MALNNIAMDKEQEGMNREQVGMNREISGPQDSGPLLQCTSLNSKRNV